MKRLFALLLAATLSSCATTPEQERALLAADLHDALAAVATVEGTEPYVEAVDSLVVAFVQNDSGFDWAAAFAKIREQEPALRAGLERAGWDSTRIETVISVARMLLRRIEAAVTS